MKTTEISTPARRKKMNGATDSEASQRIARHYQATSPMDTSIVYADRFGADPSRYIIPSVDVDKLYAALQERYPQYKNEAVCVYDHDEKKGAFQLMRLLFQVGDGILVHYHAHHDDAGIFFSALSDPAEVESLKSLILQCLKETQTSGRIHLLIKNDDFHGALELAGFSITKPEIDFSLHYNDDLLPCHEMILSRLHREGKGIVLLHGMPGTGKTTYIRYLIHEIRRKVIYVPQELAGHIGEPGFLTFLMRHPGALLIIEDAENVLLERSASGGGAIANLLNLSDGLLGDCLNIQVVCTFNTSLSRIDKALMRKGRIIARYEFGKLTSAKATALANSLGHTEPVAEDMTLAEVFNMNAADYSKQGQSIGFS